MIIRTRFGSIGPSVGCSFLKPSRTKQSFANETDINAIMSRCSKTGILPDADRIGKGVFADVSDVPELAIAMQKIDQAQADFMALPSALRKRFSNDPMELLAFISDDKNRSEAIELGLVNKPAAPVNSDDSVKGDEPINAQ